VIRALLDLNVLRALFDGDHVDHRRARAWPDAGIAAGWASGAITQNGLVRIVGQPRYPNPVSPSQAVHRPAEASNDEHHEYWPCSVGLLDPSVIDRSRLLGSRQVTDAHLLALATARGGRLVTFDQTIDLRSAHGARPANLALI